MVSVSVCYYDVEPVITRWVFSALLAPVMVWPAAKVSRDSGDNRSAGVGKN